MQIAMLLLEDGKEVGCFYSNIFPMNWPVPHSAATAAHGITTEKCRDTGVSMKAALAVFDQMVNVADVIVAHNLKFDAQMLDIEMGLLADSIKYDWAAPSFKCSMELLTPIMGLTRKNGAAKWPNLTEALAYCCAGEAITNAHDALGDVRATAKVWQWLVANGKVTL